jgi:hypothetical protein
LEEQGLPSDFVPLEDLALVCKNAANVRVVRSNSLEDEYKSANSANWSWVCNAFLFFTLPIMQRISIARQERERKGKGVKERERERERKRESARHAWDQMRCLT